MATQQLRTGRNLGPQIEDLNGPQAIRSAVNPRSVDSYYEKRKDWVQSPLDRSGLHGLASSLAKLNPVLDRMAAVKEERFVEEQTAVGQKLMQENKQSWKDFVAANPDYAGLNPHLERGYKAAYLSSRANDFKAAGNEFYTTSGLMNETDPEKVRASLSEWEKAWMAEHIPSGDYDAETFAKSFLAPVQAAMGNILARHTGDRAETHIANAMENFGLNFASTIDDTFTNTKGITLADVRAKVFEADLAPKLMAQMAEWEASGLPRPKVHENVMKSIIQLAAAEGPDGQGEEMLELADHIKVGTGTIGGKPEFKARAKSLREGWDREKRQRRAETLQRQAENRRLQAYAAHDTANQLLFDKFQKGETVSREDLVNALGPNHVDVAIAYHGKAQALYEHDPVWNKTAQIDFEIDTEMVLEGKIGVTSAIELIGRYGHKRAASLISLAREVREGKDPVTKAQTGQAMADGYSLLDSQIEALFPQAGMVKSGLDDETGRERIKALKAEARARLRNEAAVEVQKRLAKKQPPPSQAEMAIFLQDKALEIGKNYQLRKAELAAPAPSGTPLTVQSPTAQAAHNSPEFWRNEASGNIKLFGETSETITQIDAAFKSGNKEGVISGVMNRFGIDRETALALIAHQFRVYGVGSKAK